MMDNTQRFAAETSKPRSVGATLSRLWQYFRRYGWALAIVAVLIVSSTYMQVLIPNLTGQAVDCYLSPFTVARATGEASGGIPGALPLSVTPKTLSATAGIPRRTSTPQRPKRSRAWAALS